MAQKKISLNDLTSRGNAPEWASSLRRSYLDARDKEETRKNQADSLVAAIREQYPDEDRMVLDGIWEYVNQTGSTEIPEDFMFKLRMHAANENVKATKAGSRLGEASGEVSYDSAGVPNYSKVFSDTSDADINARIVEEGRDQGYWGALVDNLQGSGQRLLGEIAQATPRVAKDLENRVVGERASESVDRLESLLGFRPTAAGGLDALLSTAGQGLKDRAAANFEAGQFAYDRAADRNWLVRNVQQGTLDAASSGLSGAASLMGGPAVALPLAEVFASEYNKAIEAGLSTEEAYGYATLRAAPEGVGAIPASKFLGRLPGGSFLKRGAEEGIERLVTRNIPTAARAAAKMATTAAGEGTQEAITGSLQDLVSAAVKGATAADESRKALHDLASKDAPKSVDEFLESRAREFRAGAFMATALTGPQSVMSTSRENAEWQRDTQREVGAAVEAAATREQARYGDSASVSDNESTTSVPRREQRQPVQGELFPDTAPGEYSTVPERHNEGTPASQYDATDDAEQLRATRNRLQGRIETERARIADLEQRQQDAPILEGTGYEAFGKKEEQDLKESRERLAALERAYNSTLGGNTQQQDLPLKERRQPKQKESQPVQTRGGDIVYQPDGSTTSNVQDAASKEADKLLEGERKRTEAEAAKNLKTVQQQHADSRKKELERLATDTQSITEMDARRKAITDGIVAWDKANPKPTSVPEGWTPPKAKSKAVPKRTVPKPEVKKEEAIEHPGGPQAEEPRRRPVQGDNDKRLAEALGKVGLEAREAGQTVSGQGRTKRNAKDDELKAQAIVRGLVQRGTDKQAADALTLLNQGKVVIVPTPESVGVEASATGAAMYVPSRGVMYIWSDRVKNPRDAVGHIIKSVHEATHTGQFNEREGRSSIMQAVMGGKDRANKAEQVIRGAAKKGNKLAQQAVKQAENAGPNEQLEVMAYFAGEVAKNRQGTLGSLGGVARDMMAGAKAMLKKAGLDMDISYNDLYSAVKDVQREVARTELKPDKTWNGKMPVEMIYPNTADGFDQAVKDGRVYVNETGHEMFVLSDADASVKKNAAEDLMNLPEGMGLSLADVMDHDVLYKQMPKAKGIIVGVADPSSTSWGSYFPGKNFIELHPDVVQGLAKPDMKEILIHEIQHWIQDQQGRRGEMHRKEFTTAEQKSIEAYPKERDTADVLARKIVDEARHVAKELSDSAMKRDFYKGVTDGNTPLTARARAVLDMAETLPQMPPSLVVLANAYEIQLGKLNKAIRDYNAANTAARKRYLANITEKEAFFSQAYANAPKEAIPMNPENLPGWGTERFAAGELNRQGYEYQKELTPENVPEDMGLEMQVMPTEPGTRTEDGELAVTRRWMPARITSALLSSKGLHRKHNEIIENALTSPAQYKMQAERIMGDLDKATEEYAADNGMTVKQVDEAIAKDLEDAKLDEIEGWDAKLEAFDAAVRKYGAAGQHLRELRDMVDDMSLQAIEVRGLDPKPLTDDEVKTYTTLANNLGSYSHRMYVANSGPAGKKYAKTMTDSFRKGNKKGVENLKEGERENYEVVKAGIDTIRDYLLIPDDTDLYKKNADTIDRLYDTWISTRKDGVSIDEKREALADIRDRVNGNSNELQRRAEAIAKEMMGLSEDGSPVATYFRGGKIDNGILQKRTDIPKEVRRMMGEVTDPGLKMVATIAKQAQFIAQNKMLLELSNALGGDLLPPDTTNVPDKWKALRGEGYGPLQGYYVSPNMASALTDVRDMGVSVDDAISAASRDPSIAGRMMFDFAGDIWGKAAATSKFAQIVLNPANFMWNYIGGGAVMVMNGNFNPKAWWQAHKDAVALVKYATNPSSSIEGIEDLVARDVVDSAFIGEIKSGQYRALRKFAQRQANDAPGPTSQKFRDAAFFVKTVGKEGYAMADVVYKIANFRNEQAFLKKMYEAKGDDVTQEQIDREAADITKRTNFTFRRAAPIIKVIESRGITSFLPYMYEVFRSQVGNALQIHYDWSRGNEIGGEAGAMLKRKAITRAAGHAMLIGGVTAATKMLDKMTFGEDEEERKALRALLGERFSGEDFVKLGTDKDGYPILFQASRLDPFGPATNFIRTAIVDDFNFENVFKGLYDMVIAPRLAGQAVDLYNVVVKGEKPKREPTLQQLSKRGEDTLGTDLYSDFLDLAEGLPFVDRRHVKAATNALEALWSPGITTSWRDSNNREVGEDAAGKAIRVSSYMGFNYATMNPEKPLMFSAREYGDEVKDIASRMKEYFDDSADRSPNAVLAKVTSLRRDQKEALEDMHKIARGAMATGMTKREVIAELKKQRLSSEQINAVVNGTMPPSVVSKRSLTTSMNNAVRDAKTQEEKREVRDRWTTVIKLIEDAQLASKEENN